MVSKSTKIINPQGFHMRPAGVFAGKLAPFKSDVTLNIGGKAIDAKSIMNIMAACIQCGTEIVVTADGPDEQQALDAAVGMIDEGLGDI